MVSPSPEQVSCVLDNVGNQFPCVDIHLACASLVPLFELVPRILQSHTSLDEVDTRSYVSKVKMTMQKDVDHFHRRHLFSKEETPPISPKS